MSESVVVRSFEPGDENLILSSWLKGLYYGGSWFSELQKNIFMKGYHDFLERILYLANTQIKVACLSSNKDVIIGYSVSSKVPKALHWVHVKKDYRKIGIAKMLIDEDVKVATHSNKVGQILIKSKGWVLNPFIV